MPGVFPQLRLEYNSAANVEDRNGTTERTESMGYVLGGGVVEGSVYTSEWFSRFSLHRYIHLSQECRPLVYSRDLACGSVLSSNFDYSKRMVVVTFWGIKDKKITSLGLSR